MDNREGVITSGRNDCSDWDTCITWDRTGSTKTSALWCQYRLKEKQMTNTEEPEGYSEQGPLKVIEVT